MKKLLLIAFVLFSCQSKTEKENKNLEKKLFTYFNARINDVDSTIHLDSVRIIKFDTITANSILFKKIMSIYDNVDENEKKLNAALNDMKDALKMMRLTSGLSSALYDNSKDDYQKKNAEIISLQKQDSLLVKTADSLTEKLKTTDSTTLVYLQVRCLLQYQRKDLSVKRDTGFAFLSTDKNIVRKEDIFE